MKRDDLVYVQHALDAALDIITFTRNKTRHNLDTDRVLALAILRLLEVIGEAANSISPAYKNRFSHIPWNKMIAMRNRLIHGYFDVNYDIVWDTVNKDIPALCTGLEEIIKQ